MMEKQAVQLLMTMDAVDTVSKISINISVAAIWIVISFRKVMIFVFWLVIQNFTRMLYALDKADAVVSAKSIISMLLQQHACSLKPKTERIILIIT